MSQRRPTLMAFLALVLAAAPAVGDPPAPAPALHGTHIPVPGLAGRLVISGPGPSRDAVDSFVELAGGEEAAIAVVVASDESSNGWWTRSARKDVSVHVVTSRADADDAALRARLDAVRGVWLHGPTMPRLAGLAHGTALHDGLAALVARGGVVAAVGLDASSVGERIVRSAATGRTTEAGLDLLPGVVIDPVFLDSDPAALPIDLGSGFGLGIDAGAALVVQGRRARLVGSGSATIALAPGAGRPGRTIRLRPGTVVDLIALSRRAVFRAGNAFPLPDPDEPRLDRGTLFIGGGGRLPRDAVMGFIEAAGGPREARIVVVPTAIGSPGQTGVGARDARLLKRAGALDVRVLDVVTPAQAEVPSNLDLLRDATGVWFSGGRQWRLVDAFLDTEAHALMKDVLARGGAVSGSSAGASIQAEYMVRGHPLGNRVMMAEGYERGLGFLPGAAIDQHFTQRNRFADLQRVKQRFPQLLALGIDEGTVVVVNGRSMRVIGAGAVMIYDTDAPLRSGEYPFKRLEAGERYDLVDRAMQPD